MNDLSFEKLETLVRRHLPEVEGELSFKPVKTGKFNISYFVCVGEEEFVLRIAPSRDETFVFYERDMMRQEPEIHDLVLSRTSVPVARIIAHDESHELIDSDFLIMERLPGRPLTEMARVDYGFVLRQVGEYLAQVHSITAEQYGYLGSHCPMEPQETWAAAFRIMWHKMIDDIVGVGHYDDSESSMLRELLDSRLSYFDRPIRSSLLHMDIWHQNILVDGEGNVTALVDWDRALWGDVEIEFAVLDYCGISEPAFWEGYGCDRDQSQEARIRQIFYFLYELQKYIVIRHGRGRNPSAARNYKRQVMEIVKNYFH